MVFDESSNMDTMPNNNQTGCCSPVYEVPEEKICHRYFCYEVPHVKRCNTRIINHHIYRHTTVPCYTTCEENVCENVFDNGCH
jgi:hypothetical protein